MHAYQTIPATTLMNDLVAVTVAVTGTGTGTVAVAIILLVGVLLWLILP